MDKAKLEARNKILESNRQINKTKANSGFLAWVDFINTIKPKIDRLIDYNRYNHKYYSLKYPNLSQQGIVPCRNKSYIA